MNLPLLIFDSECPLCVRFSQGLKLLDKEGKFNFASVYDDELYKKYPFLNQEECEDVVHLVISEIEILKGGEVLEYLIREIPAVEKLAWLLDSEKTKNAVNAFYKKVNEVRRFVKRRGCTGCGGASRRKDL